MRKEEKRMEGRVELEEVVGGGGGHAGGGWS